MIKLYVDLTVGNHYEIEVTREYEISNELAEFLRIKSWGDYVDEMEEEDKTCSEIKMNISNKEVEAMLNDKNTPKSIADELLSIDDDVFDAAWELAMRYAIDGNLSANWFHQPDWYISNEWKIKDLEAGLFKPSQSFEQFLKDEEWDPSDEGFDEEEAKNEYLNSLDFEYQYQDWVGKLSLNERIIRYELVDLAYDYYWYSGYEFTFIDKEAKD